MRVSEPYTIFLRQLSSGKSVYYYQFRDEFGRRSTPKSTGCVKMSDAKRYCQNLFNNGLLKAESSIKFGKFSEGFFDDNSDFMKWKKVNNSKITQSTITSYRKLLRMQILPYFENITLNRIEPLTVKQWIVWMLSQWSMKTSNNAQSVFNIIMRGAYEKGLISSIPSSNLSFRTIDRKERILITCEELNKIYHSSLWCSETHRMVFLLASITGMRVGEICGLQKENVGANYLDVKHSYHIQFGLGDTKTKTSRYVPIPDGLSLLDSSSDSKWVFPRGEKPINPKAVYKNFCKICDCMGIDRKSRGITFHTLRNFFTSYMLGMNVPKAKVKAVIGHTDKDMTDWYTYWKPEMFPEVYEVQKELYEKIKY